MKKIKYLLIIAILFILTGCFNNDSMDNINISTSVYPIQYVTNILYGDHSTIKSIYPLDSEIVDFKITNVLLKQYSSSDLFIFNGISNEKNYIKPMLKNNDKLKIIDVSSNMQYNYSIEELWLDPNNLLTIANNIRTGFNEYIKSTYLLDEINNNYEELKIELTNLDGKYYSTVKNASNTTIIISDDAFKFLEKYGIKTISLDPDTATPKEIEKAKQALIKNKCNYIYIKYRENNSDIVKDVIENTGASTLDLYTMTNLYNIDTDKSDYMTLMNQNLENLKLDLYK